LTTKSSFCACAGTARTNSATVAAAPVNPARLVLTLTVAVRKGAILAPLAPTLPAGLWKEPFSVLRKQLRERPGAVKGAPLLGAAKRTLDGEDRFERMRKERKARAKYWRTLRVQKWPAHCHRHSLSTSPVRIDAAHRYSINRHPTGHHDLSRDDAIAIPAFLPLEVLDHLYRVLARPATNRKQRVQTICISARVCVCDHLSRRLSEVVFGTRHLISRGSNGSSSAITNCRTCSSVYFSTGVAHCCTVAGAAASAVPAKAVFPCISSSLPCLSRIAKPFRHTCGASRMVKRT
jgi:hypothetical protein